MTRSPIELFWTAKNMRAMTIGQKVFHQDGGIRWRRIRRNDKRAKHGSDSGKGSTYNRLGNNFRRVKKGLLIRKEATEDGTAIDSEAIGVKGADAVQLSELTEA